MDTPEQVRKWAKDYPVAYDEENYDPFIEKARKGDKEALLKLTMWKNPTNGNPPRAMCLSGNKSVSFKYFLKGLPRYLKANGSETLKSDFKHRAPVYSVFWHHVLFGTPILDVHTNRAFNHFANRKSLKGKEAAIRTGKQWEMLAAYSEWFHKCLADLQSKDPSITSRELDRALFQWGKAPN